MTKAIMNLGVKGEYNCQLLNSQGDITFETGFRPNMILDNFFTCTTTSSAALLNGAAGTLRVGTGTTPPVATETQLVNTVASVAGTSLTLAETASGGNWTLTATMNYQFALGAVVGSISELGLKLNSIGSGNVVHTRALITDTNSNPTSITVTSQDQLIVTYKISVVLVDTDGTGVVNIAGQNYNWLTRRGQLSLNTNSSSHGISAVLNGQWVLNGIGGTSSVLGAAGTLPTNNNFTMSQTTDNSTAGRIRKTISAGINDGNAVGGIKTIASQSTGCLFKIEFTPPIPKDSTKVFSLVVEYTLSRA